MKHKIPPIEKFKEDIVAINSDGDLVKAYNLLLWHLDNETEDGIPEIRGGKKLTYDFIITKYRQHIDQWNYLYQKKLGTKYFRDTRLDEKKNFQDFLQERYYRREFVIQKGSSERNRYIFGQLKIDILKKQLDEFRKLWEKKEDTESTNFI